MSYINPNPWQPPRPFSVPQPQSYPSIGTGQTISVTWPAARTPLKCKCGKACTYERIAKETKHAATGEIVIKAEATAVVCPVDGVIAWA